MKTKRRPLRFLLLLGAAFLFAYLVFTLGLSGYYTYNLLHPACPVAADAQPGYDLVSLTMADGVELSGWWHAPQNNSVIIMLPGSGGNRDAMLPYAQPLAQAGYGIMILESRNCAGHMVTLGWRESEDMQTMLGYALSQPDVEWVGALGFSVGGAAALNAAADDERIQTVVAMGQYANLYTEFTNSAGAVMSYEWQIDNLVAMEYWLFTGVSSAALSPEEDIRLITSRPVLLIFGELEIANGNGYAQAEAGGSNTELWVIPGAGHGGYIQAAGDEVGERIAEFFDASFNQ
ncbi:MAG TPA: alpha/beta fold hydrolase [Longilinea sp.]|nr:alpha/beta fold hydrolase [Longilinea sp.]